jgi:hypothetical protein
MWIKLFYFLLVLRITDILTKYRMSQIIFHDDALFAVYYDEISDNLHFLRLNYTIVHEVGDTLVYRPILKSNESFNQNWIFLEMTNEVKPMSHYSDVILDKLVRKVRYSMGGY